MSENPEIITEKNNDSHHHRHHDGHHHRHKKRVIRTYGLSDDMLLAFLITFAAAVAGYVENMPEAISNLYSGILTVMLIFVWLGLSIYSGLHSKWKFAVFTALFWLIPVIMIVLYESGPQVFGMSVTMYVLSEFFRLLVIDSVTPVIGFIGMQGLTCPVIFLLLNMLAFFAGVVLVILKKEDTAEEE